MFDEPDRDWSKMVLKACACVVRDGRILAFKHPYAGYQLPKGSVELRETAAQAALRELEEESGIATGRIVAKIGELDWEVFAGTATFTENQWQRWHIYLIDPGSDLPERWAHRAVGSVAEAGLLFEYFWHPLEDDVDRFHPVYRRVIAMVMERMG
ncbi:MAG: NUDIX domain-containing protein [Rhodothermales bacterium]